MCGLEGQGLGIWWELLWWGGLGLGLGCNVWSQRVSQLTFSTIPQTLYHQTAQQQAQQLLIFLNLLYFLILSRFE